MQFPLLTWSVVCFYIDRRRVFFFFFNVLALWAAEFSVRWWHKILPPPAFTECPDCFPNCWVSFAGPGLIAGILQGKHLAVRLQRLTTLELLATIVSQLWLLWTKGLWSSDNISTMFSPFICKLGKIQTVHLHPINDNLAFEPIQSSY